MPVVVTLLDVAKAAGVSKTTVGNVFSRPERVRPALRAQVEAVARQIGYTGPDPRGRLLSLGKANAIGVVPPADSSYSWVFSDPYMGEFLKGVAEVCEERRAGLSLITAKDAQGAWAIRNAVVDGFILSSVEQAEFIEPAMRRKLPFVVMDVDGGADISSVRVDDRAGARLLTRHLIDLGHRRFAVASIARRPIAPVVHLPGRGARRLVAAYPATSTGWPGSPTHLPKRSCRSTTPGSSKPAARTRSGACTAVAAPRRCSTTRATSPPSLPCPRPWPRRS